MARRTFPLFLAACLTGSGVVGTRPADALTIYVVGGESRPLPVVAGAEDIEVGVAY